MIRYGYWMMVGLVLLAGAALAQAGVAPLSGSEAALGEALDRMVAALNAHDVEGFVKGLSENVEVSVHSIGIWGTAYSREQVRQELLMNPLWGGQEFALKLSRDRVKWGLLGRKATAVVDFEMTMGGRTLRPRFIVQAEQGLDRTWTVTRLTEADNSPWKEEAPPVAAASLYVVAGFDLAPGMTEEDLTEIFGQEALRTLLQNPGIVSLSLYKAQPLPVGLEPLPEYLIQVGLRSFQDMEALGMDPAVQDLQAKIEGITRNFRLNLYTGFNQAAVPTAP
jgi:hypothetical protein